MSITDLNYGTRTIRLKTTATSVPTDHPQLNAFLIKLRLVEGKVNLLKIEFKKDNVNPIKYKYVITLQDTRKWKQDLFIPADGSGSYMNFTVNDNWYSDELEFHREIRISLDSLARVIPDLEFVEVNYL